MKKIISFLLLALFLVPCFSQSILDPEVLNKVQASVFEVVTNKAEEGSIEYEKALPFSRLPFSIRNDKYNPIGTAFLTEDGSFYSAAHVFNLYEETIYKDYYIRDRNGNVYKVDKITSFATNRDYISFTVENFEPEEIAGLPIAQNITLNSAVFSVGNALGDGIVIRNGNLTSQTYEEENGEWKWLRFSAAASPGNSGGPLITPNGEVLGIITMKSENENLNYALPFSEVNYLEENIGYTYIPFYYSLPNILEDSFQYTYTKELKLPMSLTEVQKYLIKDYLDYVSTVVNELSIKYSIKGERGLATLIGKAELLNTYWGSYFPAVFYLGDNRKWGLTRAETETYQLEDETIVEQGSMMGLIMAEVYTNENSSLEELISNPKMYMDYLFEASRFSRGIGGENIVITSLGEPNRTVPFIDYFGRIWQVNTWNIDFADGTLVSYALPLPDGVFVIYVITDNAEAPAYKLDIAFLTSSVNITYFGTVAQWEEYFALPEKYLVKSTDYRSAFNINKKEDSTELTIGEFKFDLAKNLFDINDSTNITVCTSLTLDDDDDISLTYRAVDIYSSKKEQDYRYIHISRHDAPLPGAQKNTVQTYNQRIQEVAPYNSEPYNYEQYTYLDTIIFPEGTDLETKENIDYFYIATYEMVGQNKNQEIEDFANSIKDSLYFVTAEDAEDTTTIESSEEKTESETQTPPSKKKYFSIFAK